MKPHIHFASMFLHYLPLFLVIPPCICMSISTITPTQPLKDGDLLLSKESNKFALGFFNPSNSKLRYVGVWYNSIPEQTVVWVLNRDHPVNDTSGVLSIDTSGNLLLRQGNSRIWSSNVSISSTKAPAAQLLDTGNLVLIHDTWVVWQGFDYPTDTLIPYMKLGLDKRTGFSRFLTSWKSPSDPGTGKYSARINTSGCPQAILYGGSEPLWRTGHWNGLRWSGLPDMMSLSMLNTTVVNNEDEFYEMFTMLNTSILSRLTVGSDGYCQRTIWYESEGKWLSFFTVPKDRCDQYGHCGPNGKCDDSGAEFECRCMVGFEPKSPRDWNLRDGTAGCLRKEGARVCRSGEGFVKVERAKPPETSMARVNMSISLEECRQECLKDCTCSAYAAANVSGSGSGCLSWYGDLMDTRILGAGGQDFYLRADAITLAENEKQSKGFVAKKGMTAVLVVGAALIMVLLLSFFCFLRKEMKGKGRQNKMLNSLGLSTWLRDGSGEKEHEESTTHSKLHFFDLNTIVVATDNFYSENKLGHGGFGSVYKGQLSNGQEIAVKRLSQDSGQGKKEFINEVTVIAKLQHRNLVRLLGCCIQGEEKMLVYEYLPNKSLDSFIFDETNKHFLDWRKRFEIIIGIARGILYLHHDSRLRIIHRDLKAGNVLLDDEMLPKISDFGLARTFEGNQSEGSTRKVVGTYGYMSPEYAMEGLFSTKSDIYSFGVLLLEIITGRKNNSHYEDSLFLNLVGHVWILWQEDKALNIIDPSLEASYLEDEVLRCIQIGLLCVQELAIDRPNILTVIFMLGSDSSLPYPKQPGYISKKIPTNDNISSFDEGLLSLNALTQTSIQAR